MDNLTLAYILIGIGLVLLAGELFLPTGGILFGAAIICEIIGVMLVFSTGDWTMGLIAASGVFVVIPVFGAAMLHIWPRTPLGRRLISQIATDEATVAGMSVVQEMEDLKGRYGRTISPLRPSGMVDFDGRRVDAMSEGMMVPTDQWVRCVDVKAGKVIVRAVEKPNLGTLESTDFNV